MNKRIFPSLTVAGVTLIEVLVAVAIIASVLVASAITVTQYVNARSVLIEDTVALYLAEEGYELIRAIRNDDWMVLEGLTIGNTYYFEVTSTDIMVTSTANQIDGLYTRSFVLNEVWRNSDDDIVPAGTSGATVASDVLEVVVTVVSPSGTKEISGIVSNLYVI